MEVEVGIKYILLYICDAVTVSLTLFFREYTGELGIFVLRRMK
jgi:hypothetical protein